MSVRLLSTRMRAAEAFVAKRSWRTASEATLGPQIRSYAALAVVTHLRRHRPPAADSVSP